MTSSTLQGPPDVDVEPDVTEELITPQRNRPWKYIPQFSDDGCRLVRVDRGDDNEEGEGLLQYYRHNRLLEEEGDDHQDDDLNGDLEVVELAKVVYGKPSRENVEERQEVYEEPIVPVKITRRTEMEMEQGEVENPDTAENSMYSDEPWRSEVQEPLIEVEQHQWANYATPHASAEHHLPSGFPETTMSSVPLGFEDQFVTKTEVSAEHEYPEGSHEEPEISEFYQGHLLEGQVIVSPASGDLLSYPTDSETVPLTVGYHDEDREIELEYLADEHQLLPPEPQPWSCESELGENVEFGDEWSRKPVEEEFLVETKVASQTCGIPVFHSVDEELVYPRDEEVEVKIPENPKKMDTEEFQKPPTNVDPNPGSSEQSTGKKDIEHDEPLASKDTAKVSAGLQGGTLPPTGSKSPPERPSRPRRTKSESFFGFLRRKSKTRDSEESAKHEEGGSVGGQVGGKSESATTTPSTSRAKDAKVEGTKKSVSSSKPSFLQRLGFGRSSKKSDKHAKQTKDPDNGSKEPSEETKKLEAGKASTLPKQASATGKTNIRIFEIMAENQDGEPTQDVAKTSHTGAAGSSREVLHDTSSPEHRQTPQSSENGAGKAVEDAGQVSVEVEASSVTDHTSRQTTSAFPGDPGKGDSWYSPREVLYDEQRGAAKHEAERHTTEYLSFGGTLPSTSVGAGVSLDTSDIKRRYMVAVAIDFGTAFSGYAFCFLRDSDSIHMMGRWEDGDPGIINQKTPTTLLLTPQGDFHSFGFTARNNYHDLSNDDAKQWLYFDRFKMVLYESQDYSETMTIEAANGARFSGLDVITMTLRFFHDHALEQISIQSGIKILNDDVFWIVTVPAIWNASAKQMMRLAAYKAGLASPETPDQLLVALEPEAASVHICRLQSRHLVPEKPVVRPLSVRLDHHVDPVELEFFASEFNHVVRYMVVDCGGGTVDITVHEMNSVNHRLQELHVATGGPHGSFAIDQDFERLLGYIFGKDFINSYRRERPSGWIALMMAFESRKRAADSRRTNPLNVALPFSFIEYHRKTKGFPVDEAIKAYGDSGIRWSSQGMLRLTQDAMKKLFNPTLDSITEAIENVLTIVKGVDYIFLVGGLSESGVLQCHIRDHFKDRVKKVVIPQEANLAVIKGAVAFGLDPAVIAVRRSKLTYGAAVLNRFVHGKHPDSKLVSKEGVEWCRDVFDVFVSAGQVIRAGETVVRQYIPAAPSQKQIVIGIYCTEDASPGYVSDQGVRKCANVSLDLMTDLGIASDSALSARRRIQAQLVFAETEIKVSATDTVTGKQVDASIDFLNV